MDGKGEKKEVKPSRDLKNEMEAGSALCGMWGGGARKEMKKE